MAGYTNIRNSAANANSNYFTTANVAITATNQPNIDDAVMAGVPDASLGKDLYGFVSKGFPVVYTGNDRTQIIMGVANVLKGSVNNSLRTPAAQPPVAISIPQMTSFQTVKVATAIRAGAWNEISGFFATSGGPKVKPAVSNDFAAIGTDRAPSTKSSQGSMIYNQAGGLPSTTGYLPRSQ